MKIFIVLLALSSCGADENGGSSVAQPTTKEDLPNDRKEQVDSSALMVANEEARPTCTVKSQLIYVIDIKQFQSCDGQAWINVDVQNNTTQTVNNYSTAQNIYTDVNGKEYIFYRLAQKSNLFAGKICPSGFHISTRSELTFIATQTDMVAALVGANANNALTFWTSDGSLVGYAASSWPSTNAYEMSYTPQASVPATYPNNKSALCVK